MTKAVLVVEDEFLVGLELRALVEEAGYRGIGPAHRLDEALRLIESERCDAALLDASLARGESAEAVAEALARRGIPFMVVSGYTRQQLPAALRAAPLMAKPFDRAKLAAALGALLG